MNLDFRDLISGTAMVGVGLAVALYSSSHYTVGSAARMGPGYFPMLLGWIFAALGLIIVLLSLRKTIHVLTPPPFTWRPFLAVIASVALFAVLITRIGLIPTTLVTVMVTASGRDKFQMLGALALGVSLSVIAWLIFSVGLQMSLSAFAWEF